MKYLPQHALLKHQFFLDPIVFQSRLTPGLLVRFSQPFFRGANVTDNGPVARCILESQWKERGVAGGFVISLLSGSNKPARNLAFTTQQGSA